MQPAQDDRAIPLLTPADLSFTPGTPDFTSLVASELGNLGTDNDGFDNLSNEATGLVGEAGTILSSFDGLLADAGTTLAGLHAFDPASDQASLSSASGAIDAALDDYNQQLPPQPDQGTSSGPATTQGCQPGRVVNGLTIGQPDPNPYPPFTDPDIINTVTLNVMCTNDPELTVVVREQRVDTGLPTWHISLETSDTANFAVSEKDTGSTAPGQEIIRDLALVVNPTKAGRFQAVVRVHPYQPTYDYVIAYNVTIVDAPAPVAPPATSPASRPAGPRT